MALVEVGDLINYLNDPMALVGVGDLIISVEILVEVEDLINCIIFCIFVDLVIVEDWKIPAVINPAENTPFLTRPQQGQKSVF